MAGTIVSTPALGASDWSSWITQQGLTDRGFMRLSLTNFSGSAASQVAGGGVVEVAGSIYNFATNETITLATGTASASVAVYFNVIPSAGGTTCTVAMDATAPVWSDAKQGFYASAASTTRVVGGSYIGTAATYYSKYLYTGRNLDYCLETGETRPLIRRRIEIGEWNMDATAKVTVPHDLGSAVIRVRFIWALIMSDSKETFMPLTGMNFTDEALEGGVRISSLVPSVIELQRRATGIFDSVSFDGTASTVASRGWVTIEFEA